MPPTDPAPIQPPPESTTSRSSTPAGAATTDSTTLAIPSPDPSNRSSSSTRRRNPDVSSSATTNGNHPVGARSPRPHKIRSGGGFLLQETLRDVAANADRRPSQRQLSKRTAHAQPVKSSPGPSERSGSSAGRDGLRISMDSPSRGAVLSPTSGSPQALTVKKRKGQAAAPSPEPAPEQDQDDNQDQDEDSQRETSNKSLDMDSAQIVNMALNLSESRRLASRRAASHAMPPTLAPIPDGGPGGALKQHLQQQRRTSRNISPRPDIGKSPRLASSATMSSSPMHASFDASREGSYKFQFSASTLARAQKAKDHLELMAQYRRVLEMVPPLKPRPGTSSQGASPQNLSKASTASSTGGQLAFGRPYNPLQYIRNRKVRARERKGIDGEAQGFGDVKKVTAWVDNVALWAATGQTVSREGPSLPPYLEADAHTAQHNSPSSSGVKPKRPRVDWVIEPTDMLADVYWLEKENHLQLIEDRHWRRIFPRGLETPKPAADAERRSQELQRPQVASHLKLDALGIDHPKLDKSDTQTSQGSTRDRARQKLHELKGFHRHSSSHSRHDFMHRSKSSLSAASDSDEDERLRGGPRRTFTINSKDILEKQMLEMIAREAREEEEQGWEPSSGAGSVSATTPERHRQDAHQAPASQTESRKMSLTEPSEPDDKPPVSKMHSQPLPQRAGRPSLEIPMPTHRGSLDVDLSLPNSPIVQPPGDSPFVPKIGADLSPPPTRSNSPSRNPFHKVKTRIFRDKSRERVPEPSSFERHHEPETSAESKATPLWAGVEQQQQPPRRTSPDRAGSKSPPRRPPLEGAEGHKQHTKHKSTDAGVKGIFKGARLDNVIKGGVSKIGDFIWRKDAETGGAQVAHAQAQQDGDVTQTDESDSEPARGRRRRPNLSLSRTASTTVGRDASARPQKGKHYLDVMPVFQHTVHDKSGALHSQAGSTTDLHHSRPPSRSSRFDLLKPPRIDVQHPSPSLSPPVMKYGRGEDIPSGDVLEPIKDHEESQEAGRRLGSIVSMAPTFGSEGRQGSLTASFDKRHWSLSSRTGSPLQVPVSRREVARLRALVLSSGIMAMEIARRTNEPRALFASGTSSEGSPWGTIPRLSPDPQTVKGALVSRRQQYDFAAQTLNSSVEESIKQWQAAADEFANETGPTLQSGVENLRRHIAVDLSAMTRAAADEADETSRDMEHVQRLKTKQAVDTIEKMLRRRRRRFRWLRRGLWLGVEWALVGFMWYVWFVVTILNIFLGVGKGIWRGVRWLLWL